MSDDNGCICYFCNKPVTGSLFELHVCWEVGASKKWRVGKKLGRTIYRDDVCVGMVDTAEIAQMIVDAMNGVRT